MGCAGSGAPGCPYQIIEAMQPVLYPVAIARSLVAIIAIQAPRFGHHAQTLAHVSMITRCGQRQPGGYFDPEAGRICLTVDSWHADAHYACREQISYLGMCSSRKGILETQSQPSAIDGQLGESSLNPEKNMACRVNQQMILNAPNISREVALASSRG